MNINLRMYFYPFSDYLNYLFVTKTIFFYVLEFWIMFLKFSWIVLEFQSEKKVATLIHDIVKNIMVFPAAFDQLLQLIHIAITLPVTSASTERFFPALKRVKTCMRGTMGCKRLSNLLVIYTETNCVKMNIHLKTYSHNPVRNPTNHTPSYVSFHREILFRFEKS